MNILELKEKLSRKDYDTGIVSYNEGEKLGGFNIQEIYGVWKFYLIDDKGNVINTKNFSNENDLCSYVIEFTEKEHKRLIEAVEKQRSRKKEVRNTPRIIYL